jgi:thiol-disulfide isomerase/thioredoxin
VAIAISVSLLLASSSKTATDFEFVTFNGTESHLSDYYDKPIMLNFFAMWCPYCLNELKSIAQVYDDDVYFISIAVDKQGNPVKYIHDKKYPWVFGFSDKAVSVYDADTIPVSVFIQDGSVKARFVGELPKEEIEAELNKIRGK